MCARLTGISRSDLRHARLDLVGKVVVRVERDFFLLQPSFDQMIRHISQPSFDQMIRHISQPSFDQMIRHISQPSLDQIIRHISQPSFDQMIRHISRLVLLPVLWVDSKGTVNRQAS